MSQDIPRWDDLDTATLSLTRPRIADGFDSVASLNRNPKLVSEKRASAPFKLSQKVTFSSKSLKEHDAAMHRHSDTRRTISSLFRLETFEIREDSAHRPTESHGELVDAPQRQEMNEDDEEGSVDFAVESACETADIDCRSDEMEDDISEIWDMFGRLTPTIDETEAKRVSLDRATIDGEKMMHDSGTEDTDYGDCDDDDEDFLSVDDGTITPQWALLMRKQDSYLSAWDSEMIFPLCETTCHSSPRESINFIHGRHETRAPTQRRRLVHGRHCRPKKNRSSRRERRCASQARRKGGVFWSWVDELIESSRSQ